MSSKPEVPNRKALIFLLVVVPVLFLIALSQTSLGPFIRLRSSGPTALLVFLSALVFIAFVIFALILLRILLKLYVERSQQQLGSRFKTKMVVAFLALSLVPVCFLFSFAYGLLNRSVDRWLTIPFDVVRKDAEEIVQRMESATQQRTSHASADLASRPEVVRALLREDGSALLQALSRDLADLGLESAMGFDARGRLLARAGAKWPEASELGRIPGVSWTRAPGGAGLARWHASDHNLFLAARAVYGNGGSQLGTVVAVAPAPVRIAQVAHEINREARNYDRQRREMQKIKLDYLSILGLVTVLILFIAAWLAMFISKQVTVPIQALVQATHEVSRGNLGYKVNRGGDDELGTLIRSFNDMTRQLLENRQALEQAARQLEERGNTMEAILESIPTGVISVDPSKQVAGINSTAERMFAGRDVRSARRLSDLFSAEDAREILRLFRRAARQGVITRQMELELGTRRCSVAVTVSSIRARHGVVGWVFVLEDLTDVLKAQKAAAWQEVAQRIAHEIKNPLTPIQLSTERIHRLIERASPSAAPQHLLGAVAESASLIGREVATLKQLVDEFSKFARFPASRPVPHRLNAIIEDALNVFDGRLDGVEVHRELAPELPLVQADPEQMKRAIINMVDNAAEALEESLQKEIWVRTALDPERDVVELVVADSGPGFPPEAKERVFLPYFSTKRGGTGLGLAIVSRIISDHKGTIRVEENQPTGTKFVIELPVDHGGLAANSARRSKSASATPQA